MTNESRSNYTREALAAKAAAKEPPMSPCSLCGAVTENASGLCDLHSEKKKKEPKLRHRSTSAESDDSDATTEFVDDARSHAKRNLEAEEAALKAAQEAIRKQEEAARYDLHGGYDLAYLDEICADMPEPEVFVEGMLTEGLAMLVGRKKIGKTDVAIELADALVHGKPFLGYPVPRRRKVCLLLLEEGTPKSKLAKDQPLARYKFRARKMGIKNPPPGMLSARFVFQKKGADGWDMLRELLKDFDVVIIDNIARIELEMMRPAPLSSREEAEIEENPAAYNAKRARKRAATSAWQKDYQLISIPQELALSAHKLVVLLQHAGKGSNNRHASDCIASTDGRGAAAEGSITLQKPDLKDEHRLCVTVEVRDFPTHSFEARKHGGTRRLVKIGRWMPLTTEEKLVMEVLLDPKNKGKGTATYDQLEDAGINPSNLRHSVGNLRLYKLVETKALDSETRERGRPKIQVSVTEKGRSRHKLISSVPVFKDDAWD